MANKKDSKKTDSTEKREILYQKMGGKWYAFSVIEDEVFYGSISTEEFESMKEYRLEKEVK